MKTLSILTAKQLHIYGIIKKNEIPIICYGLEIMFSFLLQILSILFIAMITDCFLPTVVYFIAFYSIRFYSGGYHATNHRNCYLISLIVYGLFLIMLHICSGMELKIILLICTVVGGWIVINQAPLIHPNRYVSEKRLIVYRRNSLILCCFDICFILITIILFTTNIFVVSYVLGFFSASISLFIAKFVANKKVS